MNIIDIELVEYKEKYFDEFFKLINNPNIAKTTFFEYPQTKENLTKKLSNFTDEKNNRYFRIIKRGDNVIGFIAAHSIVKNDKAIIFYALDERFWGKGIMTEALKIITEELKEKYFIKIICAGAHEINPASQKVLMKNGFKKSFEYCEIKEKRVTYWYFKLL